MLAQLRALQDRLNFQITVVDVDNDANLQARYDELVPVLLAGDRELCHYRLDIQAVMEFVRNAGIGVEVKPLESRP
jgi:hypothetical protein